MTALGFLDGARHPIFKESKALLSQLMHKRIILSKKGMNKSVEYVWGEGAYVVTSEEEIVNFCAKVYDMDVSSFGLVFDKK